MFTYIRFGAGFAVHFGRADGFAVWADLDLLMVLFRPLADLSAECSERRLRADSVEKLRNREMRIF
jgi:hypothetical protein